MEEPIIDYEEIDENLHIKLGDIIEIDAPSNPDIDKQILYIKYLDTNKIILVNNEDLTELIITLKDTGELDDESIEAINILSRADHSGYAMQNNLTPSTWIDIYFGGNEPLVLTGQITNLEYDMIEIKIYRTDDIIYIDFAYKGLPEDLFIDKIIIRAPPDDAIIDEELKEDSVLDKKPADKSKLEFESVEDADLLTSPAIAKPNLDKILLDADEILIGTELEELVYNVEVPHEERRFGLEKQTNDMLDELLSRIPNSDRTQEVLKNINKIIERYIQLRNIYSRFDDNMNATMPKTQGANYKPLIEHMKRLDKKLYWLLPVVSNIKKIYENEETVEDSVIYENISQAVRPITMNQSLTDQNDIISTWETNSTPDEQNKYSYFIQSLNTYLTPFLNSGEKHLASINVNDNLHAIIDINSDHLSYVIDNENLTMKRFKTQVYNVGLTHLVARQDESGKTRTRLVNLTKNDDINIKSFITLPEPTLRFSHINLPGTDIMERANLNRHFLNYWQLLREKTDINTQIISDLEKPIEFETDQYFNNIKEFILDPTTKENYERDEAEQQDAAEQQDGDEEPLQPIYDKYLNAFIPKTRVIFELINKYMVGKLSLIKILSYLEPFMIYSKDLSFKQYEQIKEFILEKIEYYKRRIYYNKNIQKLYDKKYGANASDELTVQQMFSILSIDQETQTIVFDAYNISNDLRKTLTNSEMYYIMQTTDYANLFMSAVSKISIDLMVSNVMQEFLTDGSEIDKKIESISSKDECRKYVLSKKYFAADELQADNDINIYFDKKYDGTMYDIINEYKGEQRDMEPLQFQELLITRLMDNIGLERMAATRDAISMIDGRRLVIDGDYSLLEQDGLPTEIYIRENNKWVLDENLSVNVFFDNNKLFCNVQDDCYNIDNECVDNKTAQQKIVKENIKEIVGEFDEKYRLGLQEIKNKINEEFDYYKAKIIRLVEIEREKSLIYNTKQIELANTVDDVDILESPYETLRDYILGQSDFVKKQNDIIRFANTYTRPAYDNEDIYWMYCVTTNVKLIPQFIVRLAGVFMNKGDYTRELDKICAEQGTRSDDDGAWVDKYSGYEIRKIDLDNEEGYTEEGFKLKTRDVLDEDLGNIILQDKQTTKTEKPKKKIKYSDPEAETISNVVSSMTGFMGINIDQSREFIIKNTMALLKSEIPKKEDYERKVEKAVEAGKKRPPPYNTIYNETLLMLTLVFLLVSIQASIPSIKTRKTFPGCIKSFIGYPMDGQTDKSSLIYIACVAYKIKSTIEPWSSINRGSQNNIVKKMESMIERYISDNKKVKDIFDKKREHLLLNKDEFIPEVLDIKNWTTFLPPLTSIQLQTLMPLEATFYDDFKKNMRLASKQQREQMSVIQSKIILYTFAIIDSIQKIVKKENPILTNASLEPYLENACCDETRNTMQFFLEKDPSITNYNSIIIYLGTILNDVNYMSRASMYLDPRNTKYQFPALGNDFTEETIYKAFIYFCKFNSTIPISDELISICSEKPEDYNALDTIEDKINNLKRNGINYTAESLDQLLHIINGNNIVTVNFDSIHTNNIAIIRDLLIVLDNKDSEIMPAVFREKFGAILDTYDISIKEDTVEMRDFKNYLARANRSMKETISKYISDHSKLNKHKFQKFNKCLETLLMLDPNIDFELGFEQDTEPGPATYIDPDTDTDTDKLLEQSNVINKSLLFIKNTLKKLINVFPNIIINSVDYSDINVPKHWKLSEKHNSDIKILIKKYYNGLTKFYGDTQLTILLNKVQTALSDIELMAKYTLYISPVTDKTGKVYSVFDKSICNGLFNYYLYSVLLYYINLETDQDILTSNVIQAHEKLMEDVHHEEAEAEEAEQADDDDEQFNEDRLTKLKDDELGINNSLDIIRGEKKELSGKIAKLIVEFISMICNSKDLYELDYDNIMDKVYRAKEKEKKSITDFLKDLTDEEREVENIFKNNKLGRWNVGLQKGLTQYVADTYDTERDAMEQQTLKEMKLGNNDQVSAMNRDIFMMDLDNEQAVSDQIEREEYNMSMLPDDDDYGDDMDGDEHY